MRSSTVLGVVFLYALPAYAEQFLWAPLESLYINCDFCCPSYPFSAECHSAIDYRAREPRPVLAAADGVVEQVVNSYADIPTKRPSFGNRVDIRHPNGYLTRYAHLTRDSITVRNGSRVVAGQQIALSDNSGRSTGPHLHFEVRDPDGQRVDPYGDPPDYEDGCGTDALWATCPPQPWSPAFADTDEDGHTVSEGDCDDEDPEINPEAVDRCDGVDNDCSGAADEAFAEAGLFTRCSVGIGGCRASGTWICTAEGDGLFCTAPPVGVPRPELCDGQDNDCNDVVDDGDAPASCDNGIFCDGEEICTAGRCELGEPIVCNDGVDCTIDLCFEPTRACSTVAAHERCDDGIECTTSRCTPTGCSITTFDHGVCNDGDLCTDDSCASAIGCVNTPNTAACNDRDACTVSDRCGGGTCNGTPMVCASPPPDVCLPDGLTRRDYVALGVCTDGICEYATTDTACDDADACTSDACADGACTTTPINCDDGNLCTDDSCEVGMGCIARANTATCNDGNACTNGDACSGGSCSGTPVTCDDGNPCTDDSCDSATGCVNTPNTLACDDANACTVEDTCTAGSCNGTAMVCDTLLIDECIAGSVVRTYAGPGSCSDGSCSYPSTDVACPVRTNATVTCSSTICGFSCNSGYANCDGVAENGCEVDMDTDVNNCSACGEVCDEPENGAARCADRSCSFVCVFPYVACSSSCCGDLWRSTSTIGVGGGRSDEAAVWTGSEVIVWGGGDGGLNPTNTGRRYQLVTDTWVATSTTDAPIGRRSHTAVWTGSEMIVWGGYYDPWTRFNTGGRYNPITNMWMTISTVNTPDARSGHSAIWTGTEMIVWGGFTESGITNTGGAYNPAEDTWRLIEISGAPSPRQDHTEVWTGTEMIIWGGDGNNGGRYSPTTDVWNNVTNIGAPISSRSHTAIWTGTEMIIWGGVGGTWTNTGGRYDPLGDEWTVTSLTGAPSARSGHSAIWTGYEMIVWGGWDGSRAVNTGGRYDPVDDRWGSVATEGAPAGRFSHSAFWTVSEMIVWDGGIGPSAYTNTGGRYTP